MSEVYASGTTPRHTDPIRVIEQKILTALNPGGGGGLAANIKTSAVDPIGVVACTGPGICIGTGALEGGLWTKTSAGVGTDWLEVLAP